MPKSTQVFLASKSVMIPDTRIHLHNEDYIYHLARGFGSLVMVQRKSTREWIGFMMIEALPNHIAENLGMLDKKLKFIDMVREFLWNKFPFNAGEHDKANMIQGVALRFDIHEKVAKEIVENLIEDLMPN